ncbi:MAG TPA: thiamine pyrophosphate-dependent enzyme [Pseudolysinimonas sp.]|nr:thiamine pyrophosphate-dependent enzyme [Pseudolysinimonas sp.]
MPKRRRLETGAEWVELSTTAQDWKDADPALLAGMLGQLHLIRAFEESVLELAGEGLVHGPAHSSIGQEGGAVGSIIGLGTGDGVTGSHRGHHQFLAKALTHVTGGTVDLTVLVTETVQAVLQRTLAEILGLSQGFSGGRGGSMHLQWLEAGALGTNAIVGGGVPFAAGNAFAQKHGAADRARTDLTISYYGDGSSQIGSVLESMNLASAWKLPLLFFVENNLYAVSTNVSEVTADTRLSVRGQGFSIPGWKVDGMDPLAVHLATEEAAARLRSGEGSAIIEAEVYRFFHQNGPYPGSAFGYRSKEEEAEWRGRDPLVRVANEMIKLGQIDAAGVDSVRAQAQAAMAAAVAELVETDPDDATKRRIRPALWPDPGFVDVGIRSDAHELDALPAFDPLTHTGAWRDIKFVDAVAETMDRRMEADPRIIVLGEDVHRLNGGTNGATKGLAKKYGSDRVLGTPISENAFAGLAGGLALDGRFRPVVEFMYPDFMWVAADQVFNQIGKARHMFGGDNDMPLVLRTKVAMGSGYGSQHLMDPAGIFATAAGWRIVAPSTAADYIGLMNAALALQDPVLVIEHVDLYAMADRVPEGIDLDYIIPPGTAAIRREGSDVTVISYLSMVHHALEAIDQTGIDGELIDLRWLDRASIDWDTIGESIKKTNAVLLVEQGARGTSYGGWLADELQRRFFDWLDQPIQRVTGGEASPSISKVLERAAIAKTEEVVAGLELIRAGMGRR